jgi:hypothetical protein
MAEYRRADRPPDKVDEKDPEGLGYPIRGSDCGKKIGPKIRALTVP